MLVELGVEYDSSVFPCPAYWVGEDGRHRAHLARAAGRAARSSTRPRCSRRRRAPTASVGPTGGEARGSSSSRCRSRAAPRLPFFGTSVTLGGPRFATVLARMCVGEPLVNLELHGIDVLDAADGLEALRPHQTDVRVPGIPQARLASRRPGRRCARRLRVRDAARWRPVRCVVTSERRPPPDALRDRSLPWRNASSTGAISSASLSSHSSALMASRVSPCASSR